MSRSSLMRVGAAGTAIRTMPDQPTCGAQANVQFRPYLGRPMSRVFLARDAGEWRFHYNRDALANLPNKLSDLRRELEKLGALIWLGRGPARAEWLASACGRRWPTGPSQTQRPEPRSNRVSDRLARHRAGAGRPDRPNSRANFRGHVQYARCRHESSWGMS